MQCMCICLMDGALKPRIKLHLLKTAPTRFLRLDAPAMDCLTNQECLLTMEVLGISTLKDGGARDVVTLIRSTSVPVNLVRESEELLGVTNLMILNFLIVPLC